MIPTGRLKLAVRADSNLTETAAAANSRPKLTKAASNAVETLQMMRSERVKRVEKVVGAETNGKFAAGFARPQTSPKSANMNKFV